MFTNNPEQFMQEHKIQRMQALNQVSFETIKQQQHIASTRNSTLQKCQIRIQ